MIVWGIGFLLCLLFFFVSYLKCRREFRESYPVKNDFLECRLAGHKTVRTVKIRQSGRISAPLTYGIIKPVILMPKNTNWDDTVSLDYILAHELVHIKRFDTAAKLALTAALCVHWFNPLVWMMYFLSNRDIEMSCDETVVHSFGGSARSGYARMLISMEEKKNHLAPFSSNFSKNAIEERITAIMKMKRTSAIAVISAFLVIGGVAVAFATSAAASNEPLSAIQDTNFTQEDYDKLLALHFDGYEDLAVSQYQEKVWGLTDTGAYMSLLERFSQDTQLQDMRYTNDTASFLFNTLVPLTSERWQSRDFGNYAQAPADGGQTDHAMLEYRLTLTILDAGKLKVRDYERARKGVMEGLQDFLQNRQTLELQDEAEMETLILKEISDLKDEWETESLHLAIEYAFMPLTAPESDEIPENTASYDDNQEERQMPYATKEDYRSLLKLKTAGYQDLPIDEFNNSLLEWANEDYDRNDRVNTDTAWNDFQTPLTDEERTFVTLTVRASGSENTELVKSYHSGNERKDPYYGNFNLWKRSKDTELSSWANLFYQLTYHISDESKLTIGERDFALAGVISSIQQFWDSTDMDILLKMSLELVLKEMNKIATDYSGELITISFTEDDIHFEYMSEPVMRE